MRILQIITELRPAGAERIVQTLSCGLKAAGHEVTVVSLRPLPADSFVVDKLRAAGIPIHSLGLTKATPWRTLRLRQLLREIRPDIVHAHLIHAHLLSRMVRLSGVPVVNTVHIAERRPGKGWHFLLDRWTLSRCAVQTCVSRAVATFLAGKLGQDPQSFPVILNGIEPPLPLSPEEVAGLRTAWGVAGDSLLIGSVGRLDWQKGYDRLLNILAEMDRMLTEIRNSKLEIRNGEEQGSETYANVGARSCGRTSVSHQSSLSVAPPHPPDERNPGDARLQLSPALNCSPAGAGSYITPRSAFRIPHSSLALVLLGEGPERARLEQQVAALGLKNIVVRLPGFRPDADRAMGAFDLFIMPSRYEGFGLTLLEAMSHGLPVIASDADSLPELLDGYDRGQMASFAPGNEATVARSLMEMASEIRNSKYEIRNDGDAGRYQVHHEGHVEINARFHVRRMTAEYLNLYEKLLAAPRENSATKDTKEDRK